MDLVTWGSRRGEPLSAGGRPAGESCVGAPPVVAVWRSDWALAVGVHESIIPAVVATMAAPERRASAYGLITCVYGLALFNVSLAAVVIFAVVTGLMAIPLVLISRQVSVDASGLSVGE